MLSSRQRCHSVEPLKNVFRSRRWVAGLDGSLFVSSSLQTHWLQRRLNLWLLQVDEKLLCLVQTLETVQMSVLYSSYMSSLSGEVSSAWSWMFTFFMLIFFHLNLKWWVDWQEIKYVIHQTNIWWFQLFKCKNSLLFAYMSPSLRLMSGASYMFPVCLHTVSHRAEKRLLWCFYWLLVSSSPSVVPTDVPSSSSRSPRGVFSCRRLPFMTSGRKIPPAPLPALNYW